MIYVTVNVGAGHNAIFFPLCELRARLGQGLVGNCLYQMIISHSVIKMCLTLNCSSTFEINKDKTDDNIIY